MKFEEFYPKYKPLVEEGLIKEIYYNDKESICRFGNVYALFNYQYKDICIYVNMLSDLYMLAFDPSLLAQYYSEKKLRGFDMTPETIDAIRKDTVSNTPQFNIQFEHELEKLLKKQQKDQNGRRGRG